MTCLRQTLKKHYGSKPVGIGGAFLIESGKARLHVMVSICLLPPANELGEGNVFTDVCLSTAGVGGGGYPWLMSFPREVVGTHPTDN